MLKPEQVKQVLDITLSFCQKYTIDIFISYINSYNTVDSLIKLICETYKITRTQLFDNTLKNNDAMKILCFILYFDFKYKMPEIARLIKHSKSAIRNNINKAEFYIIHPKTNQSFNDNYKIIKSKIINNE